MGEIITNKKDLLSHMQSAEFIEIWDITMHRADPREYHIINEDKTSIRVYAGAVNALFNAGIIEIDDTFTLTEKGKSFDIAKL